MDRETYLLYVAYEIYEDRDYCTDVVIKVSEEESLLGHNEDGPYTLENAGLIKYIYKEGFFYDFTSTDALAGGSYSFNQDGLIFTMNYMHMNDRDRTEVPSWFVLRELVEAKDIEDLEV